MNYGLIMMSAARHGSRLWIPSDLDQPPDIWLDWESALDESAGSVTRIYDRSPNGFHFVGGGGEANPTVIYSGLSGHQILQFDGADDFMHSIGPEQGALFRNVGSAWWLAMHRNRSLGAGPKMLFDVRFANASAMIFATLRENLYRTGVRRVASDSSTGNIEASVPNGQWHSRIDVVDFEASVGRMYVDGVLRDTNNAITSAGLTADAQAGGNAIGLGNRPMGLVSGEYPDMDLFALVVGAGWIPAESDRQRLEGWVHHGGGLQALLPADHPFRHVPPYTRTPTLQPSFASDPVVFGFVAATESSDVGVAAGPAVASEFGTMLAPSPALGAGEGIACTSDGVTLTVRLDGLTLPSTPARATVTDHRGTELSAMELVDAGGHFIGSAPGELIEGEVYYVQISAA